MKVMQLVLGMVRTNCYFVTDEDTKETFLIDPADRAEEIFRIIEQEGLKLKAVLLTHGHFDHIYAAAETAARYRVPVCAGENEAELLSDAVLNESAAVQRPVEVHPSVLLKDNESKMLSKTEMRVIATPGHTAGGVCYYFEKEGILFSGDTLFFESVGRTDLHTGNEAVLLKSIRERLFTLPDSVTVYPGHGPKTGIGYEKKNNPYVLYHR